MAEPDARQRQVLVALLRFHDPAMPNEIISDAVPRVVGSILRSAEREGWVRRFDHDRGAYWSITALGRQAIGRN